MSLFVPNVYLFHFLCQDQNSPESIVCMYHIQNQEEDAANQTPLCVHSKNASTKLLFKNKRKVSLILRTPINHTFQIPKTS